MELQMQLELGDIDDAEYVRREAELMARLREVRAWRERFGKGTSGGPVRMARDDNDDERSERARLAARQPPCESCSSSAKAASAKRHARSDSAPRSRAAARRRCVVSTDPAAALGDVIGAPVGDAARPVRGAPRLQARQLDAAELRQEFLERWRDVIAEIVDRGTYLDAHGDRRIGRRGASRRRRDLRAARARPT